MTMGQQRQKPQGGGSNHPSTGAELRTSKARSKGNLDSPFNRYMKRNYGEHFRRIKAWRRAAKWALLIYPLVSALSLATPCVALYAGVKQLYLTPPEWFSNFLSAETQSFVLPALLALSGFALFFGLFMGIGFGISRARMLTFEAERTELSVRHSYFLRRIARSKKAPTRQMLYQSHE